ncbi:MAG: hypothetical protein RLZZ292_1482 [Bacteroidota bacterium]
MFIQKIHLNFRGQNDCPSSFWNNFCIIFIKTSNFQYIKYSDITDMNNSTSSKSAMPSLGDLGMIRDILMGEHINNFETQFDITTQRINALEAEIKASIQALDEKTTAHFAKLTQDTNTRLASLQQSLEQNVAQLTQQLAAKSKEDKHSLGLMLVEMGKQLMK